MFYLFVYFLSDAVEWIILKYNCLEGEQFVSLSVWCSCSQEDYLWVSSRELQSPGNPELDSDCFACAANLCRPEGLCQLPKHVHQFWGKLLVPTSSCYSVWRIYFSVGCSFHSHYSVNGVQWRIGAPLDWTDIARTGCTGVVTRVPWVAWNIALLLLPMCHSHLRSQRMDHQII